MLKTTMGQLLLNNQLPATSRDYGRVFDKKSMKSLFEGLVDDKGETYRDVNDKLHRLSSEVVTSHGNQASLSLDAFKTPIEIKQIREGVDKKVHSILNQSISAEDKRNKIIETMASVIDEVNDKNYALGLKNQNPLALQVQSGSRGTPTQFRSITAGDLMFVDHKERPIPIPILRSYGEGLDPVQYWAGGYGARRG